MSNNAPESAFELESSRLNEGLKSCRTVVNNYRAMMLGDQANDNATEQGNDSDLSSYVSTTGSTAQGYESDSGAN